MWGEKGFAHFCWCSCARFVFFWERFRFEFGVDVLLVCLGWKCWWGAGGVLVSEPRRKDIGGRSAGGVLVGCGGVLVGCWLGASGVMCGAGRVLGCRWGADGVFCLDVLVF